MYFHKSIVTIHGFDWEMMYWSYTSGEVYARMSNKRIIKSAHHGSELNLAIF